VMISLAVLALGTLRIVAWLQFLVGQGGLQGGFVGSDRLFSWLFGSALSILRSAAVGSFYRARVE